MSSEDLKPHPHLQRKLNCPVLVSERLILREPHVEDMDAMAKLANNRRVSSMLQNMPYPYTRKHAANFILRAVAGELGHCVYAITLSDTGEFIGVCDLKNREDSEELEIGYWLGEPYWRKGYATEAVNALIDAAFRASDIEMLYVSCFAANEASRRVIQKIGFSHLGTAERHSMVSGVELSEHFVLDRARWLGLRSLCA